MNDIEATKILAILTAAYPNAYKNMSDDEANGVVAIWTLQFADTPADIVFMALNKAISGCKFPPTISEIKNRISALHWEAYEAIRDHESMAALNGTKVDQAAINKYRRIHEATAEYKVSSMELSLKKMVGSGSLKYLE